MRAAHLDYILLAGYIDDLMLAGFRTDGPAGLACLIKAHERCHDAALDLLEISEPDFAERLRVSRREAEEQKEVA